MQTTNFVSPATTASYLLRAFSPLFHQAALATPQVPSLRQRSQLRATEDGFELQVRIPGATSQQVQLELDGNDLRLRVEAGSRNNEEYRYIHRERSSPAGALELSFRRELDADNTTASLVDGVLTISGKYRVRSHRVSIQVPATTSADTDTADKNVTL